MADTAFQVEVVSVEERLWSGEATFVIAQTTEGELGVLAHHEPLFGQLTTGGAVAIDTVGGERLAAAIRGGFLSVHCDAERAEVRHHAVDGEIVNRVTLPSRR